MQTSYESESSKEKVKCGIKNVAESMHFTCHLAFANTTKNKRYNKQF